VEVAGQPPETDPAQQRVEPADQGERNRKGDEPPQHGIFPRTSLFLPSGAADPLESAVSPEARVIDLYTWTTPNGRKVSIMLEETGLPYRVHPIDIGKGEQHTPEFLAINPNNRIPAIVDAEGPDGCPFTLFESGAILLYLAWKSGRFLPRNPNDQFECIQWLMFQMGGIGPMFGQVHHFLRSAPEPVPYAIERYTKETRRLYRVLDGHLSKHEFLAAEYSIADIATYPWIARHEWHQVELDEFPAVHRWYRTIGARPAVQAGMKVPAIRR
jgi:GST-like protein